jgi:DNA polymerase I-like protein with 3'-5' exonuclease and polymerase domains
MTVHDSVILDVHKDEVYNVASLAKAVLENAPHYLKEKLSIDFPCRLSAGVEVGENWQDKEEYDL